MKEHHLSLEGDSVAIKMTPVIQRKAEQEQYNDVLSFINYTGNYKRNYKIINYKRKNTNVVEV